MQPTTEKHPKWQSFINLVWYDQFIALLFRFVSKTAEPLLAIGVIVSAADFLQQGRLMAHNPTLADAWSWTQALAIEASTGPTLVFALQAFQAKDKTKGWLYMVLAALLFLVGGAMLLLQMISNVAGLNEATINPVVLYGLFVSRVIVASGMVALTCTKHMRFSGMLSDEPVAVQAPAPIVDVASIVNELDARLQQRMEQRIEAVFERVQITIEQAVGNTGELPAVSVRPALPERTGGEQGANNYERVKVYVATHPGVTVRDVATALTISTSTASKHMKRLKS